MSVMGDKGQVPHPWQCPMYGGYPQSPYSYQSYEPQPNFYYYHGGMPFGAMNGHPVHNMMQGPIKPFTPGGHLQPFGQNKGVLEKEPELEGSKDLPPLPPGPPPSNPLPQPSPPGSSPFYQPSNAGGGPVRFNMNRQQRPQFNQQSNNLFNNSGAAKKKRKKKNKFNNQQGQGQGFTPPLPPHQLIRPQPPPPTQAMKAPPLPPGPPPVTPQPPPDDVKPPEPKQFPPKTRHMLDNQNEQKDWPPELQVYITRCYAKCQSDVDKDRVSIILKGKIMRATNDGTLWIKDWANEPLPMLESDMATLSIQPVVSKIQKEQTPTLPKKRLSSALTSRLGLRLSSRSRSRSHSRSRSRSRSHSPQRSRQRSPRNRRRRERSGSSDSESDWIPMSTPKKNKSRNMDHSFSKQSNKGKNKGKGRGHFYSEFGDVGDVPVNSELLEKRAARFNNSGRRSKTTKSGTTTVTITNTNSSLVLFEDTNGDFELEDCHIIGVCQDIEKPYLRLTTAPEAVAVRPPDILRQSLSRVKERWVQNQDYHYVCEQLKSIRQDLTVQGIRDKLTVSVYETHARIALEKGDHAEFNQCQSQLKLLYDELSAENRGEFTAYRILYFIFTKENMDLNTVMTSLSEYDRLDECISHALNVRSAWALNNYHRLFRLYCAAPRMSSYLMDWFMARERKLALKTIIKAYRQTLPVSFLTQELAFQSDSLCREFLSQFGVIYADGERTKIDCKTSAMAVASV